MARPGLQGIERFAKDVLAVVDVAEEFALRAPKRITPAIQGAAMDGEMPDGNMPKYSAAYQKIKDKESGKNRKFMVGVKKPRKKHVPMMSDRHFKWQATGPNTVEVIWEGTGDSAKYGPLHQEGGGKQPRRTWMHLQARRTVKKIYELLGAIVKTQTDKFTKKYGRL